MSKHMRFFKHEIPLDLIKAFSASDMYTAEWIMFITHFLMGYGCFDGVPEENLRMMPGYIPIVLCVDYG